jgi:eukaryotic-like serine/threonine-protein kinase
VVGSTVGPYRVLARLGAGGMGEVFLGDDPRLGRRVALKCVSAASQDGEWRAHSLREARAAARLTHPNIAAVHDVLEQDGRMFIVMEYVEGESLAARLARGALAPDEVTAIGRQLASAMSAAHADGVIHRDLKPANIQLSAGGSVKVLDFGVAKLSAPRSGSDEETRAVVGEPTLGGRPGTATYMAPEQLSRGQTDARSDIYSLGLVLFEAATGVRPFPETDVVSLALAAASRPAPEASSINPAVPPTLGRVIARALEFDPTKRFASARELELALGPGSGEDVAGRPPPSGPAGRDWWRQGRRRAIASVCVMVIVVATVGGLLVARRRGTAAAGTAPSVLAILPIDNPSGNAAADDLGAVLESVVYRNFRSVPGLTVLSRETTASYGGRRDDLAGARVALKAAYVLDIRMTSPPPAAAIQARMAGPEASGPLWTHSITGDALSVQTTLLQELLQALKSQNAWRRRLTDAEGARIRQAPTTSATAMAAYAEARSLLDRPQTSATRTRALELAEQAVTADRGFALAHAALADAYVEAFRAEQDGAMAVRANDAVAEAIRLDPDAASVYRSLGNVRWAARLYQEAEEALRRAIERQPDDDDAHRVLGRVLADRQEWDAAIGELEWAVRIRPYWTNYMALAAVSYSAGRYNESRTAYRRAAELKPNEPGPFVGLGIVAHVTGDLAGAIGNAEHAVRLGPSAMAYSNLGTAYYAGGRYRDAVNAWKEARALAPKYVLYRRNTGDAYRRLHEPALAAAEYEAAIQVGNDLLKVNARDAETIALVAVCEAKLGRAAAAERHAAEALALAPTNRTVLQRKAEVFAVLGQANIALDALSAAIGRGYSRPFARINDEFESLRTLPAFQALVSDQPEGGASRR